MLQACNNPHDPRETRTTLGGSFGFPLSSEFGTNKTVTARFWAWLEPFFRRLPALSVFRRFCALKNVLRRLSPENNRAVPASLGSDTKREDPRIVHELAVYDLVHISWPYMS